MAENTTTSRRRSRRRRSSRSSSKLRNYLLFGSIAVFAVGGIAFVTLVSKSLHFGGTVELTPDARTWQIDSLKSELAMNEATLREDPENADARRDIAAAYLMLRHAWFDDSDRERAYSRLEDDVLFDQYYQSARIVGGAYLDARERAAAEGGSPVDGLYASALSAMAIGEFAEAEIVFSLVLEENPLHREALVGIGEALLAQQNLGEAESYLSRALAVSDRDPVAMLLKGQVHMRRQDFAEAVVMLERAAELAPDDPEIADSLGWALIMQNRIEEGLPHLVHATGIAPRHPDYRLHLAIAYARQGDDIAADAELRQVEMVGAIPAETRVTVAALRSRLDSAGVAKPDNAVGTAGQKDSAVAGGVVTAK